MRNSSATTSASTPESASSVPVGPVMFQTHVTSRPSPASSSVSKCRLRPSAAVPAARSPVTRSS